LRRPRRYEIRLQPYDAETVPCVVTQVKTSYVANANRQDEQGGRVMSLQRRAGSVP